MIIFSDLFILLFFLLLSVSSICLIDTSSSLNYFILKLNKNFNFNDFITIKKLYQVIDLFYDFLCHFYLYQFSMSHYMYFSSL